MKRIACEPGALRPEENDRRRASFTELSQSIVDQESTSTSVTWKVQKTREALVAAGTLLALESQCCPFLHLSLDVPPDQARFTIRVEGPEGTRDLLEQELVPPARTPTRRSGSGGASPEKTGPVR